VRAVIDTNVLLSGLLWRGPAHRLIEAARAGDANHLTLGVHAGIPILDPAAAYAGLDA
jgi:hypothetical protein